MKFVGVVLALLVLIGGAAGTVWALASPKPEVKKVVTVLAAPSEGPLSGAKADDELATKVVRPLELDRDLVLPEKIQGRLVNNSDAVLQLDLDLVDPKTEPVFAKLYPSYKAARDAAQTLGEGKSDVLVSSSLVYSKTRDFDHGLIVAAEMALVQGKTDKGFGVIPILKALFPRLAKTSVVRPYVAAALEIGGEKVEIFPEEITRKNLWINRFRNQTLAVAPPLDYYSWSDETRRHYDFVRFTQDEFSNQFFRVALDLAQAFLDNPDLLAQYDQVARSFQLLSRNRREFLVLDFATFDPTDDPTRKKVLEKHQDFIHRLQFMPETSRREFIHFAEYLPVGTSRDLDPMAELIQRSAVGLVSILPRDGNPGIEQVQAIAMDVFLAETPGPEAEKTLLSRVFRERSIRPYYAVEQRTTDPTTLRLWKPWTAGDTQKICPKLRVEPVAAFYLRLARNYKYIGDVLRLLLGEKTYAEAKRLTPEGSYATEPMPAEIERMVNLCYGLYLVTCEDIGIKPSFGKEDSVDRAVCYNLALEWLNEAYDEIDSARDCRYDTWVHFRTFAREILCWSTIGVRLQKLTVSYARRPQLRADAEDAPWFPVEESELGTSHYVLPVLELAGVDVRSRFGLETKQFRELCDKHPDRQSIIEAAYALDPPAAALKIPTEEQPKEEVGPPKRQQAPINLDGLPDPIRSSQPDIQSGIGVVPQ